MSASSKPPSSRSSLHSHSFPAFYACYLLKSEKTAQSRATYVGSTPSPSRRIRQHNGELTQGAWKTKHGRPWVMQMIVHGFPSKLAALQFEWAWQHPNLSRHLRDPDGTPMFRSDRNATYVKLRIEAVRVMLATHPYHKWPLHVKLFTEEAVRVWNACEKNTQIPLLPRGLSCSVELEGVDGKSGKTGSGRQGPILVNDEPFTSAHLAKNATLLAQGLDMICSVCRGAVLDYASNHLTTALCPAPSCSAISHLKCLAQHFLGPENKASGFLPRGGTCLACQSYVLWGDVVRGCYRRSKTESYISEEQGPAKRAKSKQPSGLKTSSRRADNKMGGRNKTSKPAHDDVLSEGEFFLSSADDGLNSGPVKRNISTRSAHDGTSSSGGESFDLEVSSTDDD